MHDHLFLLESEFEDAAMPGQTFYCRHCIMLSGLFAAFPEKLVNLDVTRVAFPRPRMSVIERIGEANQNLPVLLLAPDAPDELADGHFGEVRFVGDFGKLLHALHVRHGFPVAHP